MQNKTHDENNKSDDDFSGILIKKYANRRLYNTKTSNYVTLADLHKMVKDGVDFAVKDAKSGEDITCSILTQIIMEEESKGGHTLLPESFLRNIISFYGDRTNQITVPHYLEVTMNHFKENQQQFKTMMEQNFGTMMPFSADQLPNPIENMEKLGKQNLEMMQKAMGSAMGMMQPPSIKKDDNNGNDEKDAYPFPFQMGNQMAETMLSDFQKQMNEMQKTLDRMTKKAPKESE